MRIDAGNSYLAGVQRAQPTAAAQKSATAPFVAQSATRGGSTAPDFTDMTRKDLFDWMNDKIRSGEMSLDDSTPFLAMTVKVPVGGGAPMALDDQERMDFVQQARDGIAGALFRNDRTTLGMLETAMRVMQAGVDRLA